MQDDVRKNESEGERKEQTMEIGDEIGEGWED